MEEYSSHVTLLVGCLDRKEILRFPSDDGDFYGLSRTVDRSKDIRISITQLIAETMMITEGIEILEVLDKPLKSQNLESRLVVARVAPQVLRAKSDWLSLPVILRKMSPGPNRILYNKAFQLYAGTTQHSYDILEMDEEVRNRLQEITKNDKLE